MDRSSSKRKACAFEVKVTPKKLRSDVASSETVPVLVLAPFHPHPKLTMENVKVGTTRRLQLSIFNPTSKEMIIELVNVPSEEDGFSFSDKQMRVAAENSVLLGVEWTPKHCLAARHVVGVRPLGRTRNLSEIVLIVSAPKPQGLRNRLMKQDQLAKTELKMKRRSTKPLSEKNDHLEPVFQTTEEDINERRTTFTVVKFKGQRSPAVAARTERKKQPHHSLFEERECENLVMQQINSRSRLPTATITAPAEETADLCSPLRNDQPETALTAITPSFFNKTFNLSNTSSPARSSTERFSTDSLEGMRNTQVERRMTRSAERLSLETVNIDSPTGIPLKPRSRCTRSAERINVDLFHQESLPDMEKRVSRPVETPLERSNSLDSLFVFDSRTEVSVKDDVFECRTSISPQPPRRMTRSAERLSLETVNIDSPTGIPLKPRSRCTRSAERSTVDLFHLESLPDMEKRVSRPVERRGREETDTMMTTSKFSRSRHRIFYRTDPKVSQTPLERFNSLDSLFVFDSPTEASVNDDVFECCTSISPQPRSRSTRSAERSTVDLFHLESLPDLKRMSRPLQRRADDADLMTPSPSKRARPEKRGESSRCTRSVERVDLDLFNLDTPPSCAAVSKKQQRRSRSCLTVNDSRLDVRSFEDKLDQLSFSAINDDGNIDFKDTTLSTFTTRTIESQAVLDCNVLYTEKAASLDNVDGGKTNVAGSCVDRSGVDNVETGLPTALGVSPPKRRRTPKREAVARLQKREAYSVGNSADASAVAMATRLRITVDDASASSSDGGGFWNVSPPKRLKLKPPSDSPVVLPPPSRVARRSTLKQRLSPGGGRTVVVRRRCESQSTAEEEAKPVASRSSAALNSGCATVGRPLPNKRQATNRTKVQSCTVSRLLPRRLRLGSSTTLSSASSMTSLAPTSVTSLGHQASATSATTTTTTTSAFLCQPSANDLPSSFVGHSIDLSKNPFHQDAVIYLENSWIDETEKDLLKWVNKILSPPLELQATCLMPSKQELQCVRPPVVGHAAQSQPPVYRLFSVRRAATALLLSPDVARVLRKVYTAIDRNAIAVRADKDLHRDLGLQGIVLHLLMCYHPLWLRVALEAVYGRPLHLHSNSDVVGLVNFIRRNLLTDNYLRTTFAHPTVPHLMLPPFEEKMKKFILNKFVMIVYFLDQAKRHKLIRHDPCLFCKDSPFKDSRAILLEFNKEMMKGGDMTKYLATMGMKLEYKQTYLEEFEFRLKDRSDLRDGVRLVKLVDIMLNERICHKLRTPAVSRTQKVHNVGVALAAFRQQGNEIENDVTAKDVVDGHRERTLSLLWQLRGLRQQEAARVLAAFWLQNKPMIKLRMRFHRLRHAACTLQKWYRAKRANANADRDAFLRMRAAAVTIQQRWRANRAAKQARENMLALKKAVLVISERRAAILKMRINRQNFTQLKSAAITIQTRWRRANQKEEVTVSQLASQLALQAERERNNFLELRSAAIVVQRKWRQRRKQRECTDRQHFLAVKKAAITIGARRKAVLLMRNEMARYKQVRNAAICIQRKWRAKLLMWQDQTQYIQLRATVVFITQRRLALNMMRKQRNEFIKIKNATILLQQKFRATMLMKQERKRYEILKKTVSLVMERRISILLMRNQRNEFIKIKNATILLQQKFRATMLMKQERKRYEILKKTVSLVTERRISILLMRNQRNEFIKIKNATILLQQKFRATMLMKQERKRYEILKKTVSLVTERRKASLVMRNQRKEFIKIKNATILLQRKFRATMLMKQERKRYEILKKTVSLVTERRIASLVMRNQRNEFIKIKNATILLQRKFRATMLMKQERKRYEILKKTVSLVTERRKASLVMRNQRKEFIKIKNATILLQRKFRATMLMKQERKRYEILKKTVSLVTERRKASLVMRNQRKEFIKIKNATILLQRKFRATMLMKQERKRYEILKKTVSLVTERRIASLVMRNQRNEFIKIKNATILLQRKFRATMLMKQERKRYEILKKTVSLVTERRKASLVMRNQRKEFIKIKNATILLQRKFRATMLMKQERKRYEILKKTVSLVTERRKASLVMRNQRKEFIKIKNATILLQRKFRATMLMKQERKRYEILKKTVSLVTERRIASLVMRNQRNEFIKIKNATILLQRKFRATMLMKQERKRYEILKKTVSLVTERRKASLVMRNQRKEFIMIKNATILLQRKFRATMLMKQERKRYEILKKTVSVISERRLSINVMRKQQNEFIKIKNATICLQQKWRCYVLMKKDRACYLSLKNAVSIVAERRLAIICMRKCRSEYLSQRSAIVKLQLRWKSIFANRTEEQKRAQWLKDAKKIVDKISERRIALLKMRQDRLNYLRTRAAIITIQRRWREVSALRRDSRLQHSRQLNRHAYVIQRAMRNWMTKVGDERQRRELAAVRIQSMWRGHRCRQALRLESRHSFRTMRVSIAGTGKTLREKKHGLLQTLCQSISLHVLIRSLKELDVITTMSPVLAGELVHEGIIAALYNLLDRVLSRTVSDQEAALLVVTVLANLYKHSSIASTVWTISVRMQFPAQIFTWASNSCRTNSKLFCACITLLWLWAHKPENCPLLVADASFHMKRITEKVVQLKEAVKRNKCGGSGSGSGSGVAAGGHVRRLMPSINPDWGYTVRINYRPRHFEDPIHAWGQLKILLGPRQHSQN